MAISEQERQRAREAGFNNELFDYSWETRSDFEEGQRQRVQVEAVADWTALIGKLVFQIGLVFRPLILTFFIYSGFAMVGYWIIKSLSTLIGAYELLLLNSNSPLIALTFVCTLFVFFGYYYLRGFIAYSNSRKAIWFTFYLVAITVHIIAPCTLALKIAKGFLGINDQDPDVQSSPIYALFLLIFIALSFRFAKKVYAKVKIWDETNIPKFAIWIYNEGMNKGQRYSKRNLNN